MPAELETIVNRALVKDKDQRYQTVGELHRDLKRLKQNLDFEFQKELPEHTHSRESGGIPTAMMPARSLRSRIRRRQTTSASMKLAATSSVAGSQAAVLIVLPAIVLVSYLLFAKKTSAIDSIAVLPYLYKPDRKN